METVCVGGKGGREWGGEEPRGRERSRETRPYSKTLAEPG